MLCVCSSLHDSLVGVVSRPFNVQKSLKHKIPPMCVTSLRPRRTNRCILQFSDCTYLFGAVWFRTFRIERSSLCQTRQDAQTGHWRIHRRLGCRLQLSAAPVTRYKIPGLGASGLAKVTVTASQVTVAQAASPESKKAVRSAGGPFDYKAWPARCQYAARAGPGPLRFKGFSRSESQ